MKYDDASWHYGADFYPEDQPDEHGATHIALFLRWCFSKGWAGALHLEDEPEDVQRVIEGTLSATDFLFKYCDGKLTNASLSAEGNRFAEQYYGRDGLYPGDYAQHFAQFEYVAPESAHDFVKFSSVLEARLQSGLLTKRQTKPWWKIW